MANSGPVSLDVSSSIGNVSGEYILPGSAEYMLTLAHGAGAGMTHTFMVTLANKLADLNIASLRFNFPFTEQKKRKPDLPAVAHKTIEAAANEAHKSFPNLPLFLSGKSFGGRMSSQYLAAQGNQYVRGVIFYGFPLHPAGKPGIDRAEHLKKVDVPMLFLQGTRDELATWDLIAQVTAELKNATLVKIEGADHAFKAGKQDVISLLAAETLKWMQSL